MRVTIRCKVRVRIRRNITVSKKIQSADVGALPADATDTDRIRRYEAEIRKQLTPEESDYLFGNFEVIAKNKRDISQSGSNFDATVWRGRNGTPYAGEVHISLRPTQALPGGSYWVPDIDAYESAYNQVRDMYNWWMRVNPDWESVRAVREVSPKSSTPVRGTVIPIRIQRAAYIDAETGQPFMTYNGVHTKGGLLLGTLGLGLGGITSCWPKDDSEILKKVDIGNLLNMGESK